MPEKEDRFEPMEEARKQEQEFFGREMLASREQYAKRDPLLDRLTYAENPKDVQAAVDVMKHFENFGKQEISRYRLENYISAALIGAEVFKKDAAALKAEQIVEGGIGADGYLVNGGRIKRAGYTIRIDSAKEPRMVPVPKEKRYIKTDERGDIVFDGEGNPVYEKVERWVDVVPQEVERPYFGPDKERKTLAKAYEAGADMLLIRERIHTLYKAFSDYRADLDGMITLFYTRLPWLSNEQIQKIFTMPDISKMTPENEVSLENREFGTAVNDTMRLLYLAANSETKGKIEIVLNTPGFKEKLLPNLKARLRIVFPQRFTEASQDIDFVKFLVGDLNLENDKYKVNWVPDEKRAKKTIDIDEDGRVIEKDENGKIYERGYLTEFGNIYTDRAVSDENENTILARIELILGNQDAVRVGNRLFKIFGLADELGLETYKAGKDGRPIEEPTAAKLEQAFKGTYNQWRDQAKKWQETFSIKGEPVASDLSKLMHAKYYRLNDILRDRPAGPMFTLDQFKRLTLSLLSLNRSKVKITGQGEQWRTLLEQWWGYEVDGASPKEPAKDLGDIEWDVVVPPKEVKKMGTELKKEAGEEISVNEEATRDEAWGYYVTLLFLAGQDNPLKRPWAFLNFEDYNPQDFLKNNFYTNKSKFLQIIKNPSSIGPINYRGRYREFYIKNPNLAGNFESTNTQLSIESKNTIRADLKNYWSGVKSLPQWQWEWAGIEIRRGGFEMPKYLTAVAEEMAKKYGYSE